ncbi:FAD-dependent oxidoreductase [Cryobacterium sp. SO1]|uniref:FAD-dependent oxidoreductase n=1 Tax=Cryobacterium sp. SO1 TaxID=1897061 RepID=UPI0010236AC7|nr:FAD-dependent oxidoreductase [Cryobacterium sp. SO1]RZI34575.1 hypothetical protein BJQ95_03033 [Cryobacterium sp. SO1]
MPFLAHDTLDLAADIAVIGGGLGGIAAALAAADTGSSVIMTAEESMIGGQITAQLTAPLDEHPRIETWGATRSYRRFRDLVRAESGGVDNPGDGWVSRLCFEPLVGLRVLEDLLRAHTESGRLRIVRNARPVAATVAVGSAETRADPTIEAVRLVVRGRPDLIVRASVFIDATELGDLLPLTDTAWTIGSEGSCAFAERDAVPGAADALAEQSCTWAAVLVREAEPQPVVERPPGYVAFRDSQPFTLDLVGTDGAVARRGFFTAGPTGLPSFWSYRRIRTAGDAGVLEAAVINWAGNDYRDSGLVHNPEQTRQGARALTLAFVHWLRTEAPRDSPDGPGPHGTGRGYPELRLAPELTGTPDGLAEAAYVRESRRLANPRPITGNDIAASLPGIAAPEITDSVGIAWYQMDLHPRVGHPTSVYGDTAPFHIPARALVPALGIGPANLLMGAKNLAATQVAAAAYRVHPAEWAIGEAAGTIAARCLALHTTPRRLIHDDAALASVQSALHERGAPVSWQQHPQPDCEPAPNPTENPND